jgi:hypothetical protein
MTDNLKSDLRRKEADDIAADLAEDAYMHEEARLLREEFNPLTPANFCEAMREVFAADSGEAHAKAICEYMRDGQEDLAGCYIKGVARGYWTSQAAWFARKDI